ncbi:helix-turn-helix domain-containing protein [Saccharopolyspora griseoalba]|uniref:Helix-turn-helix domain-containing protein n=1 Tax=Saccharopolyspora griseoalba TaxID=1431848 RepID=A0ABW2LF54_9PSEU
MIAGESLRAAREAAGLSLTRMAQRTHLSKSYLSMVETGKRPEATEVTEAYEQVLGVAVRRAPADPVRIAHEWLVGDSPVGTHLGSGRLIGESLVREIEQRVIELRHLDDVVGHLNLLPAVTRELDDASRLLHEARFPDELGRRLGIVVGELAQLAGWIASDAGRCAEARRPYLDGVRALRRAREIACWAGSCCRA